MEDIDHEYTHDPVCPHCGYKMIEAWELPQECYQIEVDCGKCDKPYLVTQHITIKYSTEVKQP